MKKRLAQAAGSSPLSASALGFRTLLLEVGPLRILLRDNPLDAFSEKSIRIRRGRLRIRSGFAEVQIFLVFESFGSGTVVVPVLLISIQVQDAFQNGDENTKAASDQRDVVSEPWNNR